ncbi:MAG: hypothetical protein HY877_09195 [Deltaproteobacteria bacterium]|nr:hypothetical protein [Deltaproteobacteria bacterium]
MILRTLYYQKRAIPLRHVSSISNLPIFSVQNAIHSLVDDNLIIRTEKDNNVLFELNEKYFLYSILEQFFILEANNRISLEAKLLYQKARATLEFANTANIFFRRVKQKRVTQ